MGEPRDIEKDKALCEAATSGPWEWKIKNVRQEEGGHWTLGELTHPLGERHGERVLCIEKNKYHIDVISCWFPANSEFVAESRTALPYYITKCEQLAKRAAECFEQSVEALDENEVLKARIAELEQEVKELSEEIMWRSSP